MDERLAVSNWRRKVTPFLNSKREELHMLGYPKATNKEIWECLKAKVWKGNPEKRLHEVVQDILHLSASTYISYLTINAFQDDTDLMASIKALTSGISE